MTQRCKICNHEQRAAIDAALVSRGGTLRDIAGQFSGTSKSSLARHKESHLPASLVKANDVAEIVQADDLLARLDRLCKDAHRIKGKAEADGDLRTALAGIRELVRIIELLAKIRGELDESPKVNVLIASPDWIQTRMALMNALSPYPEARAAVAQALLETGNAS